MQIRQFERCDEAQVIALWEDCQLTRPWNDPRKDIARKLMIQRELFLVGVEDGHVIATAMAGYDGHRGWINYLAVASAYRVRGNASALMTHLELLLLRLGCPKINLQVRASNLEALAFYQRLGYGQDEVICFSKRLIVDETVNLLSNPVDK